MVICRESFESMASWGSFMRIPLRKTSIHREVTKSDVVIQFIQSSEFPCHSHMKVLNMTELYTNPPKKESKVIYH